MISNKELMLRSTKRYQGKIVDQYLPASSTISKKSIKIKSIKSFHPRSEQIKTRYGIVIRKIS